MSEEKNESSIKILFEEGGEEEVSMPFVKTNMMLFIFILFLVIKNYNTQNLLFKNNDFKNFYISK